MAAAELIQELIRAHVHGDDPRFRTIALQLAAREARSGHRLVAGRIRDMLEQEGGLAPPAPTPIAQPSRDLRALLDVSYPEENLSDIVLKDDPARAIRRLLTEQRASEKLAQRGLRARRKLLLYGAPGCGKSMSARVLARELGLPLMRVRVETLFSRFMGETANVLVAVFDEMERRRAVYLFDEFDAIGKQRDDTADVGEAKRIVSTFLQLMDSDTSGSVIVAATNQRRVLDPALPRRFDDLAFFDLPSEDEVFLLLEIRTRGHRISPKVVRSLASDAVGLSFADVAAAVEDAAKTMVLQDRDVLRPSDVRRALDEARVRAGAASTLE